MCCIYKFVINIGNALLRYFDYRAAVKLWLPRITGSRFKTVGKADTLKFYRGAVCMIVACNNIFGSANLLYRLCKGITFFADMQINVWILADKSKFRGVGSSVVRLLVCAIRFPRCQWQTIQILWRQNGL